MKKILLTMLILFIAVGIMTNCGPKKSMIKNGETYAGMEGWIDDNTFQVKAMGFAPENITDVNQRKYMAQRAAQVNAEARIVEKIIGASVEGKTATENGQLLGEVIKKNFQGYIKGGTIVEKTFDKETQACEITYRITGTKLKKKVESAISEALANAAQGGTQE
jgi:hypothetical protein